MPALPRRDDVESTRRQACFFGARYDAAHRDAGLTVDTLRFIEKRLRNIERGDLASAQREAARQCAGARTEVEKVIPSPDRAVAKLQVEKPRREAGAMPPVISGGLPEIVRFHSLVRKLICLRSLAPSFLGWPGGARVDGEMALPVQSSVPRVWSALRFRTKTQLLKGARMVRDLREGTQRYGPSDSRESEVLLAESAGALWPVGHEANDAERALTLGKIHNLRVAARRVDGARLPAGEVFSFWK